MRLALVGALLAAPLCAELLETTITFQGTGCVSCAESLEPRLARVRGVEKVELDLANSTIHLVLEPGNKARIGPLRLRVTQDGTQIVGMTAVVQGYALEKDGAWMLSLRGLDETLSLEPAAGVTLEAGSAYRMTGRIVESAEDALSFEAEDADPIPQP